MKKNKATKILLIISLVILVIGFAICFLIGSSISQTNDLAQVVTTIGALLFQVLTAIITVSSIVLIWLIYGLIILIKRIKEGKINWKLFAFICTFILLTITIVLFLFNKNKNNHLSFLSLYPQLKIIQKPE